VRVREGAEHPHAERVERGHPLGVAAAVLDAPVDAIEVRPDPAQHPLRQEVRVHVGQTGQAEVPPEAGHVVIDHILNLRSTGS
jgi:hypothetical protein